MPDRQHEDLGAERSRYVVSERYLDRARLAVIVLAFFGLGSIGIGIVMSVGPEAVWWEGVGPWILGVAFLFLSHAIRRQSHPARSLELRFFERGLSYEIAGSEVTFSWDGVQTYLDLRLHSRRYWRGLTARFERADGRIHRLRIDNNQVPDLQRLGFEIALGCARAHRDEARSAWQRGEAVPFGELHVSREYLRRGNTTIAWADVEQARVVRGRLRIRRRGRRLDWVVRLGGIPNVPVLVDLIQDQLSEPAGFPDLTTPFGSPQI